jgi:undecaprenyl phosphate-alpha-L-ara4N flippase subunit ArnE
MKIPIIYINIQKSLLLMLFQTSLLVGGQVFFKLGMQGIDSIIWSWDFILHHILLNIWLLVGVAFLVAANLFWLWLLKMYPFSVIYPLTSLGFVFGMLSGMLIFHETVTITQWIGVVMVMGGCYFIAAQ